MILHVPALADVNSAVHCLRTDICTLGIGYYDFTCPRIGGRK